MNNRAYSLMQVKAVNEDSREITGIASTPEPDRYGDIVDPAGVKFTLPLPLLWQHWHDEPMWGGDRFCTVKNLGGNAGKADE